MDRRTFVKGACLGSAGLFLHGLDPTVQGEVSLPKPPPIEVHGLPHSKSSPLGMPGLFPGRVMEISDPSSIVRNRVSQRVVHRMLERGMKELTGESSNTASGAKLLEPNDVVGIVHKSSGTPSCCTSHITVIV